MRAIYLCFFVLWMPMAAAAQTAPLVVASIKPVHSLVASVMEGTGDTPRLIVDGTQSPHDFQLKPSHRQALADAEVVFYIHDGFETYLPAVLAESRAGARHVALMKETRINIRNTRFLDSDGVRGAMLPYNYHVWLSAANAGAMAQKIAEVLGERFPAHKEKYLSNARELRARLQRKDAEISHKLAPVMGRPFLVFHDGYLYFEERYGLNATGAITQEPEQPIGAARLARLRQMVRDAHIRCIFREPQFSSRLVDQVAERSQARIELIDPEGATITPGPGLYETLLDQLSDHYLHCLEG